MHSSLPGSGYEVKLVLLALFHFKLGLEQAVAAAVRSASLSTTASSFSAGCPTFDAHALRASAPTASRHATSCRCIFMVLVPARRLGEPASDCARTCRR